MMEKTDYRLMFDRNYVGHLDLAGKDVTLTIKQVKGGELTAEGGRKSRKPIIHFTGDVKPLIANKTNSKTIAAMYGPMVQDWAGKRVTLFTSMTRNPDGGGQVECVRIRPKVPSIGADTGIAQQPEAEEHILASGTPKAVADQAPLGASEGPDSPAGTPPDADAATTDLTAAQAISNIEKATDAETLTLAAELARSVCKTAPDKLAASTAYRARLAVLKAIANEVAQ